MAGEAGHAFHGSEEGELFRFIGDFYDSVIEMDPAVSVGTGKSLVFRTFVRKECGSLVRESSARMLLVKVASTMMVPFFGGCRIRFYAGEWPA